MPFLYKKEQQNMKYIEYEHIEELRRLKQVGRTSGYAPSDIASVTNLYRLYINSNASGCSSCSNNLAKYTKEIYNYLGSMEESSLKHYFDTLKAEVESPALEPIVEVTEDKSAEQQVDEYVNANNTLSEPTKEVESQEVIKPKRKRRTK